MSLLSGKVLAPQHCKAGTCLLLPHVEQRFLFQVFHDLIFALYGCLLLLILHSFWNGEACTLLSVNSERTLPSLALDISITRLMP